MVKSETLESKLEKPDWKQWIPVYGWFKMMADIDNDKPIIFRERSKFSNRLVNYGIMFYQGTSFVASIGMAGYVIVERLGLGKAVAKFLY